MRIPVLVYEEIKVLSDSDVDWISNYIFHARLWGYEPDIKWIEGTLYRVTLQDITKETV